MHLPDVLRTTTFRRTALACAICIGLFSTFLYLEVSSYIVDQIDSSITEESLAIADDAPARRLDAIDERLRQDPRRIKLAALFRADGYLIQGNLERLPPELGINAPARNATVVRIDQRGREIQTARAVARSLPDGHILVIGRNIEEREQLLEFIGRVILWGLPIALIGGLVTSMLMSMRLHERLETLNVLVQRIVAGDLKQRLPSEGLEHPFDKLAAITNGMLDEIETLLHRMAGVGNEIAHDLRTPLTRVRVCLERGRNNAQSVEELQAVMDRAIGGLDQSLSIITALLRIAELEQSQRVAGFGEVALANIVREVGDLYEPIAEDKGITLAVRADDELIVHGDRDLLLEAVANLVDNAVKFTPQGGRVELVAIRRGDENVVRISDSGPGIHEDEHDAVMKRFYRSDKSRHTPGVGLGLSLVAAIVKLHAFSLAISSGPRCVVEISGPQWFSATRGEKAVKAPAKELVTASSEEIVGQPLGVAPVLLSSVSEES